MSTILLALAFLLIGFSLGSIITSNRDMKIWFEILNELEKEFEKDAKRQGMR